MKKPRKRTLFSNASDELNYLNDVIVFLERQPCLTAKDAVFVERFHKLLLEKGVDDGSIMLQEHWALYYEFTNDFAKAIPFRLKSVELTERVIEIGGPVGPVDQGFLLNLLNILAEDYLKVGEMIEAGAIKRKMENLKKHKAK